MRSGHIQHIPNTNRKFGEAEGYFLMYDSEGKGYIFTKEQLKYAHDRFTKHPEDAIPLDNRSPVIWWLILSNLITLFVLFVVVAVGN